MSPKLPVTAVVSTKNEERAIDRCLDGLKDFQHVVVVDSLSSDRTPQMVREHGVALVSFEWNGAYPKKKQWCLDNLSFKTPWVLFIDADETPSAELIEELFPATTEVPLGAYRAYDLRLSYRFAGRQLEHGHTVVKRALVQPDHVTFPVLDDLDAPGMGELEGHYQPTVAGRVGRLRGRLIHDDPDPVGTWIDRHNGYADWEAYLRTHQDARRDTRRLRSRQGRLFDRLPGKPLLFFLYSFVMRRGYLDGRAGFDYAFGLSFYYWLIGLKVREASEGREEA